MDDVENYLLELMKCSSNALGVYCSERIPSVNCTRVRYVILECTVLEGFLEPKLVSHRHSQCFKIRQFKLLESLP